MILTNIMKHLIQEHHLTFIENQQTKDFGKLTQVEIFIKALISQADNNYLYVFDSSMTKSISDTNFDLIQVLFIYDALLNLIDEGIINIDKLLGDN
ncbi:MULTISPECIES: hypothetical protein [Cysteiniphilum]|uniref:Uncharacterized protein n=1 Tax=Cysteiniphilum litorale TaxID=2056700 RepID=A0A8J2Z695_9GAMM|nr:MULTISPECIES: hypothetical protein [Cysteiniphilum]WHN64866.1 hypothetical protein NYP54_07360 [Cysteiniphilum sp. QT6929]GGG05082.1 hypothetical protein GCM10010995_23170 [Cysteiniphilum litorale]